mmetsp:Transcript_25801/g.86708  ORF Transcript_25801/g.86708 Transcript_25801/m.86708 type:complete len:203 (-) Transcript_25801:1290-1898(-)
MLGRRDVRRGVPLPERGPLGSPPRHPRGGPERVHTNAHSRRQRRGVHFLPRQRRRRLRAFIGGQRHGRLPHLRLFQRRGEHESLHRRRAGVQQGRRSVRLLHFRHGPLKNLRLRLLPVRREEVRRGRGAHDRDQRHGRFAQAGGLRALSSRHPRRMRFTDPLPHALHIFGFFGCCDGDDAVWVRYRGFRNRFNGRSHFAAVP